MNQDVRKWLWVGSGFGVGAALITGIICGGVIWYSKRPEPWDEKALIAQYRQYTLGSLWYTLENHSGHDFSPTERFLVMCKSSNGTLSELPTSQAILPPLIPAGKAVQIEFQAPDSSSTALCPGFILYDRQHHYQINLPVPVEAKEERKQVEQRIQEYFRAQPIDQPTPQSGATDFVPDESSHRQPELRQNP